jgi:hypothetical protein
VTFLRQAVTIVESVAAMRADVGPLTVKYRTPLDRPNSVFEWAIGSTATDDGGVNVIVPLGGGMPGAWLRITDTMGLGTAPSAPPTDLYVSASGSDIADGSSATPLATIAEAQRRMRAAGPVTTTPTVHLASTITETWDPCAVPTAINGRVTYAGTQTTLATGTLTSVTGFAAGGPTEGVIADSGQVSAFWSAHVSGHLVVLTSGTHVGAYAWPSHDLGSGACNISPFWSATADDWVTPTVGDTYSVVSITTCSGAIVVSSNGSALLTNIAATTAVVSTTGILYLAACDLRAAGTLGSVAYVVVTACRIGGADLIVNSSGATFFACFFDGIRTRVFGGVAQFPVLNYWRGAGASIQVSGNGYAGLSGGAFFAFAAAPIVIFLGPARMHIDAQPFGNGTATDAIQVNGGCHVELTNNTVIPNITGTSNYASIGGTTKLRSDLATSFFNTTNGASFVYPQT